MNNDLSSKILESYQKFNKIYDDINNNMLNFITKANELVELSEDNYQIEKSLKLNKISLKAYILDSSCCISLSNNNITNYSIQDLKQYFKQYEQNTNEDYYKYNLAISLYEALEDIEKLIDNKINLEINELSKIIPDIKSIEDTENNKYETLYNNIKIKLDESSKNSLLDEKSYKICIEILNDIFNFYINGYPNIPDEYLYNTDDLQ